jgi:hypothetical protein
MDSWEEVVQKFKPTEEMEHKKQNALNAKQQNKKQEDRASVPRTLTTTTCVTKHKRQLI